MWGVKKIKSISENLTRGNMINFQLCFVLYVQSNVRICHVAEASYLISEIMLR